MGGGARAGYIAATDGTVDFGLSRFLINAPLLAGLPPAARDDVIRAFRPRPFGDGEALLTADADPGGLLVLVDGAAEVWIRVGGRRAPVGRLAAGDAVGAHALFGRGIPRVADVVGLGTGIAALLPTLEWQRLVAEDHPAATAIEIALVRSLCFRLHHRLDQSLPALADASEEEVVASLSTIRSRS